MPFKSKPALAIGVVSLFSIFFVKQKYEKNRIYLILVHIFVTTKRSRKL